MGHQPSRTNPNVDAGPVMAHVRALSAKGMPLPLIVERSGVAQRSVYGFLHGFVVRNGARHQVKQATASAAAAVLAVEFEPGWNPEGFSPEKFKQLRESRNLSRRSLARLTGLTEWTFQYWEQGRSVPTRKANVDAALKALHAEWQDISGPAVQPDADEYEVTFRPNPEEDLIPNYPCGVCGNIFRSRTLLARHPHPRRVEA